MRQAPAFAATARPAGVLPVRVTAATAGAAIRSPARAEPTSSVRKASAGKPAACRTSSIARAQPETFEACLRRPTLPAMSAGAAKRKTCQKGKFQGMTARTGPSGSKAT